MNRKKILWSVSALLLLALTLVQFIPSPPVIIPAQLAAGAREAHRLLAFEGISNFRDLGGYRTRDGRTVKWGKLYRSGTFAHASRSDLASLEKLELTALIDFRSAVERGGGA